MIIKFRKARRRLEDAKTIAEIEVKSGYRWGESMQKELRIAKKMLKFVSLIYIAEHKSEAVGYFALTFRNKIDDIDFLSVKKKYHNKGIGTKLLNHMIRLAKKNNKLSKIRIAVWAKNLPAIGLYKKFGFSVVRIKRKYYPNRDDKAVMEKMLR